VRRVKVDAEISWDQQAAGSLDITNELLAAFAAAGSPAGVVSSYTGQGLEADWPEPGADLRGGWRVGEAALTRADGVWKTARYKDARITAATARILPAGLRIDPTGAGALTGARRAAEAFLTPPVTARFYVWEFRPRLTLDYAVSRQRFERVSFELTGDVQRVFADAGEDEEIILSLASRRVSETIDGSVPLGSLARPSYINTDRGRQSLDYLVALARSRLLARARAVEIECTVPYATGAGLSCRMNSTIIDSRLPGGSASGKVIAYRLSASGDGSRLCDVTIGCTIGNGATETATIGTPAYVDDGYVDDGYQKRTGQTYEAIAGEVTYPDLSGVAIDDDGLNLMDLRAADVIDSLSVLNGESAQASVLNGRFADIPAAIEALNAAHTEVVLELTPLVGGPFETEYTIAVSSLAVPQTLTL
jgi:hypothetical protein